MQVWALIVQQETGQHVFILNFELHFLVDELTQERIVEAVSIFVFLVQDLNQLRGVVFFSSGKLYVSDWSLDQ